MANGKQVEWESAAGFEGLDVVEADDRELVVKEISNIDPSEDTIKISGQIRRAHAATGRKLANALVIALIGTFVLHYGITVWLNVTNRQAALESVNDVYDKWLPVIAGLAGTAVAFFLSKERQ